MSKTGALFSWAPPVGAVQGQCKDLNFNTTGQVSLYLPSFTPAICCLEIPWDKQASNSGLSKETGAKSF